jgi:hypothetical protein
MAAAVRAIPERLAPGIIPSMRLVVSTLAEEAIKEQGGRLYVWPRRSRCCGGTTTLSAATSPPARQDFRREEASTRFELYLPTQLTRLPDELHIDARGRSRRVQAYWDGCAWIV